MRPTYVSFLFVALGSTAAVAQYAGTGQVGVTTESYDVGVTTASGSASSDVYLSDYSATAPVTTSYETTVYEPVTQYAPVTQYETVTYDDTVTYDSGYTVSSNTESYPIREITGEVVEVSDVYYANYNDGVASRVTGPSYGVNLDGGGYIQPAQVQTVTYQPPVYQPPVVTEVVKPVITPPVVTPPVMPPKPVIVDRCGRYGKGHNYYVQGGVGGVFADNMHATINGARGNIDLGDAGLSTQFGVGVRFTGIDGIGCDDHFRVGLQDHYLHFESDGMKVGGTSYGQDEDVQIHGEFLTLEYAPDIGSDTIRPYIGVGVGIAGADVRDNNTGFDLDWNFAYKGTLGVSAQVSDRLEGYAEYNYYAVPSIDLKGGRFSGETDLDAHAVMFGLRYHF